MGPRGLKAPPLLLYPLGMTPGTCALADWVLWIGVGSKRLQVVFFRSVLVVVQITKTKIEKSRKKSCFGFCSTTRGGG